MRWRGGCLAAGLVHGAVPHYCLGGSSALFLCARHSLQVRGDRAGDGSLPPPLLPPSLAPLRVRVKGCPVRLALSIACWYAIPRGLCVPRALSGCTSGARLVPAVCALSPLSM